MSKFYICNHKTLSAVFQTKVIEMVRPQKSDEDEAEPSCEKKTKLKEQGELKDDGCGREKDALEIQRQHEQFMDSQAMRVEQYVKRKRRLATVSSKAPVVEANSPRPGMEGKGPRVVPQSVKNYRKRLKKKARREKSVTHSEETG